MSDSVAPVVFKCDLNGPQEPLPHFWEHTVGSCHATMALRADWQRQLKECHERLGFRHVRFHGLLSDDMCTLVDEDNGSVYSFFNTDQIWDYLLSIGMKPFVELSFMPTTLASGGDIVFHYKANVNPPKDYTAWATLINKLVAHWVARYGEEEVKQWFFEVWNEPNLNTFWKGTKEEYFKLYQYTAKAIKDVSPALRVGGPATANNEWIADFTVFYTKENIPCDFITTHHYPTDSFGQPGDDTVAQLAKSHRSVLREMATKVKEQAAGKPVYYTEWSTSSNPFDDLHDLPYAAAFIIKTVLEARGLVDGYSYWTFSDIFEENYFSSMPFHGGFGLMNIYGIPKPAFYAFELLHHFGDILINTDFQHPTADIWVSKRDNKVKIMITNWALPRHEIHPVRIALQVANISEVRSACIERIDDDHANARKEWETSGKPDSLSPELEMQIRNKAQMKKETIKTNYEHQTATIFVTIPVQGSACITLETI